MVLKRRFEQRLVRGNALSADRSSIMDSHPTSILTLAFGFAFTFTFAFVPSIAPALTSTSLFSVPVPVPVPVPLVPGVEW
jgi:hypothetical protein